MNKYYVYIIKYKEDIIYIGKGTKNRYLVSRNTNTYLSSIPNSFLSISKIFNNLTNLEALAIESKLIKTIKPVFNTKMNVSFSSSKATKTLEKINHEIKKYSC